MRLDGIIELHASELVEDSILGINNRLADQLIRGHPAVPHLQYYLRVFGEREVLPHQNVELWVG